MAKVILKSVRLSYPCLWVPKEYKVGDGRPRWSATFLIEPGSKNDMLVNRAIEVAAFETWTEKAKKMLASCAGQKAKHCYIDGDISPDPEYEGLMALAAHRATKTKAGKNSPPLVVDRMKNPLTEDDGLPYAGCYVNAVVDIYCQTGENYGVRATFSAIQFDHHGEAFGTAPPSADDFEDLGADDDEEEDFV